jgi:hypothetical protein
METRLSTYVKLSRTAISSFFCLIKSRYSQALASVDFRSRKLNVVDILGSKHCSVIDI